MFALTLRPFVPARNQHDEDTACAADDDDDAAEKLMAMYKHSMRCEGCGRVLYRRGGCEHV